MWKSSSLKRCLNASVIIVSLWSSKIIIKSILAVTIQFSFRLSYTTMSFHFCFSLNDSSLFFPEVSAIIPRRSSDHIDVPSLARVCVGSWLRCWREKHVSCWIVLPNYIKDGPTLKAYFLLSLSSCVCVCVYVCNHWFGTFIFIGIFSEEPTARFREVLFFSTSSTRCLKKN